MTSEIGFSPAAKAEIYQRALKLAESTPKIGVEKPAEAETKAKTKATADEQTAADADPLVVERIILETLGLIVIGRTANGDAEIYSKYQGGYFVR